MRHTGIRDSTVGQIETVDIIHLVFCVYSPEDYREEEGKKDKAKQEYPKEIQVFPHPSPPFM